MGIDLILEFNLLAETLNFTEAAKQLYISQPTLSKHVSALEQELGLTLIERQPTVRLTYAGREFHRKTAALLDGIPERLDAIADEVRETTATTNVIRMPDYTKLVPSYFSMMADRRGMYEKTHEASRLRIEYVSVADWRNLSLEECFARDVFDAAFVFADPSKSAEAVERELKERGLIAVRSGVCPISFIARADSELGAKRKARLLDLDGLRFFSHCKSHVEQSMESALMETLSSAGIHVAPKKPYYITDSVDVWGHVEMQDEILLCPTASLRDSGFDDQVDLAECAITDFTLELAVYCVTRKEAPRTVKEIVGLLGGRTSSVQFDED